MSNSEVVRLKTLRDTGLLDTVPEEGFDRLTALAAALFDAPIALVSLIDEERQWFKSRVGLEATETPRAWAFCNHAIRQGPDTTLVVEDATADDRFADNPLVTGDPNVRFYAGATLTTSNGVNLGALCVIDRTPRSPPSSGDLDRLRILARMVVDEIELFQAKRSVVERGRLLELAEAMSGVGHWRFDIVDNHIVWSDEVYRIHGVERSSFNPNLGAGLAFYHPDDRDQVAAHVERAIADGVDYAFQHRLLKPDGEVRHVTCKAICDLDAHGRTTAIVGVFQDVTDQVRALETVERSEARYRLLTENANDLVTEMDRDGRFRYVSPAVKTVTGYEIDEAVGKIAMDFIHPDDHERVKLAFAQAIQGPGGWRIEYRIICKDGRTIWVEARPTISRDAASGQRTVVTDVIRDITDRKRAEAHLAESESRYRLLADNASEMISRCKFGGEITFLTPGCRQVLGYEPEDLIGRRTLDLMHPEDKGGVLAYYADLIARGPNAVSEPFQFRALHKDGGWVWLEGQPKVFFDPHTGAPIDMQDVVRDITTRKALEEELRHARADAETAAAVKGEFLANMSHELRTPLTSILGFSKLLAEQGGLEGEGRRYLQRVSDASQALLTTVNDILDFSKLEAGQVEIAPRPADPKGLIESALELLAPQADAKALFHSFEHADLPASVMVDDTRLRQILLNFASNAVKFTSHGGVTVKASYDHAEERLRCEVIDTGSGVPADRLDRLFKRFSQVDASTTRSHGGTGLGLAICKGLAEAMGGSVGASSIEGAGSTFWVELPCPAVAVSYPTSSASAALEGAGDLAGLRMLIIDDNAGNRELVRIVLSPFGVDLAEASSGRDGVQRAQDAPFDVILMDVRMPDLDGPSAALLIRQGDGPNRDAPIIAFTADAGDRAPPPEWASIFDDRLPKPIIAADLLNVINAWNPARIGAPQEKAALHG